MSWYDTSWTRRAAIVFDNTGGASPIDGTLSLPKDFPDFWDNVLASGNDVRVTDADGFTLLTYDLDAFNTTTKVGTIEIDAYAPGSSDAMVVAWLYWGNSGAADARTVFAPAAAKTGSVETHTAGTPVIKVQPERPGEARPRNQISKNSNETIWVWFDFADLLLKRDVAFNGSMLAEEVDYIDVRVDLAGVSQAAMVTRGITRLKHPALVRVEIKAGADGSDYTVICFLTTTLGRVLRGLAWLKVRNVDEA